MYKNNHTTSTKCKYHAAASRPKWCLSLNSKFICRINITNKNKVPTIKCNPLNPVAIKNIDL